MCSAGVYCQQARHNVETHIVNAFVQLQHPVVHVRVCCKTINTSFDLSIDKRHSHRDSLQQQAGSAAPTFSATCKPSAPLLIHTAKGSGPARPRVTCRKQGSFASETRGESLVWDGGGHAGRPPYPDRA